jgi:hypothetical protein
MTLPDQGNRFDKIPAVFDNKAMPKFLSKYGLSPDHEVADET